jgi:hypothetical protein
MAVVGPKKIVFIDPNVPNIGDLLGGLQSDEEAFVLDPGSDGLQQIADILAADNLTDLLDRDRLARQHRRVAARPVADHRRQSRGLIGRAGRDRCGIGAGRHDPALRLRCRRRDGRPAVHRRFLDPGRRRHGRGGDASGRRCRRRRQLHPRRRCIGRCPNNNVQEFDRGTPGGWGGIRTHEELAPLPVFKTGAFNRSATHP